MPKLALGALCIVPGRLDIVPKSPKTMLGTFCIAAISFMAAPEALCACANRPHRVPVFHAFFYTFSILMITHAQKENKDAILIEKRPYFTI